MMIVSYNSNMTVVTSGAGITNLPNTLAFTAVISRVRVALDLLFSMWCFVDHCPFVLFSVDQCVVCPSLINGF